MDSNEPDLKQKESRRFMASFSVASFLNDFGSDMIYPIWPLFVTEFLGANVAVLGLIEGIGDSIVSLSQVGSGYLSDKWGRRKPFIWIGYLFGASSRIGYALSTMWQHLIPFRILDRAGKMRGAPRDAIVADISTNENRGRNFGLLRAMDNLGAVCGIIAIILLFLFLGWNYQNLFLLASLPSLIGALLILVVIKERRTPGIYKGISLRDFTPNFKLFLFLSSIFAFGSFSYSFLLISAKDLDFQDEFIPVFYLVFTVVASLTSLPFGKFADKFGRRFVLILSYLFWAFVCLGFIIYAQSYVVVMLLFVLYGLHKGAIEPVQKAFVSELSPVTLRASMLGTFQMVVGMFALPASAVAGTLWVIFERSAPFYLSLGLTSISIILMLFVREQK